MDNRPVNPNLEKAPNSEQPSVSKTEVGADWARQIEELKTPEVVLERISENQNEITNSNNSGGVAVDEISTNTIGNSAADLSPAGIEKILEKDLSEVYQGLPDYLKPEFRKKGEETASKISVLLKETKLKIKEIIDLILDWLKIVPGLNEFFIEKEAEIKADEILNLYRKQKGGSV